MSFLDELKADAAVHDAMDAYEPVIPGCGSSSPGVGDVRMWDGTGWVPVVASTTGVGASLRMPSVGAARGGVLHIPSGMTYPASGGHVAPTGVSCPGAVGPVGPTGEPEIPESEDAGDPGLDELCEVLLCSNCDMELGATPCGPRHAYLADHPMEHRLLAPLLKQYLRENRADDKPCAICKDGRMLGVGNCPHTDVREDQVRMSYKEWLEFGSTLDFLNDKLHEVEDTLGNSEPVTRDLIWWVERASSADLASKRWWDDVADDVLERMRKRLKLVLGT